MGKRQHTSNTGKRGSGKDPTLADGGESRLSPGAEHPPLTTNQGVAIADNQNNFSISRFQDITHFDHERIPERIVHARATGVHGFFELTASLKQYTIARILTEVGEKTPGFRPHINRRWWCRLSGYPPGRTRIRGQVLLQGRQLGPGRQQYPGVFHPGCHKIPGSHPRPENGTGPRVSAIRHRA